MFFKNALIYIYFLYIIHSVLSNTMYKLNMKNLGFDITESLFTVFDYRGFNGFDSNFFDLLFNGS